MDLDRKAGPLTIRAWGLVLNFACNAVLLLGLSRVVRSAGGEALLALGGVGTLVCLAVLARPSR
jgi:hypothetical protein